MNKLSTTVIIDILNVGDTIQLQVDRRLEKLTILGKRKSPFKKEQKFFIIAILYDSGGDVNIDDLNPLDYVSTNLDNPTPHYYLHTYFNQKIFQARITIPEATLYFMNCRSILIEKVISEARLNKMHNNFTY